LDSNFIEKLYEEYYSFIKLIVKNSIHTSNSDDITSCVQDVFVIAMQKEGLEKHANIKAWLLKTTKNIVKSFNRKKAINNKYFDFRVDYMVFEPSTDDFSDSLIEKIDSERLKGLDFNQIIIESLSRNERDFYALLYHKKLSIKEISKVLNISEGAAATRNTRLKEKIKKVLENL
jgi:RNA polymerase sigma-70 factor (ECF subfamily)